MKNILEFLKKFEKGATEDDIIKEYPNLSQDVLAENLNTFLSKHQIEIINEKGILKYKVLSKNTINDEEIILNTIKESGSKGVWIRDIKLKTNMPQTLILKVLKNLEHKLAIKVVKSVKSNQKIYVAFDQVPDDELTGGVWFNEGEIDEEFISEMSKIIYIFLCRKTENKQLKVYELPTIEDIHQFVANSKISSVNLNINDLKVLLDTMVADESIQQINFDQKTHYRSLKQD